MQSGVRGLNTPACLLACGMLVLQFAQLAMHTCAQLVARGVALRGFLACKLAPNNALPCSSVIAQHKRQHSLRIDLAMQHRVSKYMA